MSLLSSLARESVPGGLQALPRTRSASLGDEALTETLDSTSSLDLLGVTQDNTGEIISSEDFQSPKDYPKDIDPVEPKEESDDDDANILWDMITGVARGVEGSIQSVYNLLDFSMESFSGALYGKDISFPDYDKRFIAPEGTDTVAGGLTEGITQFLVGFIPAVRVLKVAQAATKAGKFGRITAAGAVADFAVFDGLNQRLSDLIEANPKLRNPVTAYLASDDNAIHGRIKNTIEGVILGSALTGLVAGAKMTPAAAKKLTESFTNGLDVLRKAKKTREGGEGAQKELGAAARKLEKDAGDAGNNASPKTPKEQADAQRKAGETFGDPEATGTTLEGATKPDGTSTSIDEAFENATTGKNPGEQALLNLPKQIGMLNSVNTPDELRGVLGIIYGAVKGKLGLFKDADDFLAHQRAFAEATGVSPDIFSPENLAEFAAKDAKWAEIHGHAYLLRKATLYYHDQLSAAANAHALDPTSKLKQAMLFQAERKVSLANLESSRMASNYGHGLQNYRKDRWFSAARGAKALDLDDVTEAVTKKEELRLEYEPEFMDKIVEDGGFLLTYADDLSVLQTKKGVGDLIDIATERLKTLQKRPASSLKKVDKDIIGFYKGQIRRLTKLKSTLDEGEKDPSVLQKQLSDSVKNRLNFYEMETGKVLDKVSAHRYGSGSVEHHIERIKHAASLEHPLDRARALANTVNSGFGRALVEGIAQVHAGHILSGPPTMTIAPLGNIMSLAIKTVESAMAGGWRAVTKGDTSLLRATLDSVSHFEDVAQAWKNTTASLSRGGERHGLMQGNRPFVESDTTRGALAPEKFNVRADTPAGKGLQWANTWTKLPMRLLGGMDEFFKVLSYLQLSRRELMMEGIERKGITDGHELATYVANKLDKQIVSNPAGTVHSFSEKGLLRAAIDEANERGLKADYKGTRARFINRYMAKAKQESPQARTALAQMAEAYAKDATFTEDLTGPISSRVAGVLKDVPILKPLIPFLTTPYNILAFALKRSPIGAVIDAGRFAKNSLLSKQATATRKKYWRASDIEKEEILGRLSFSASTVGAMWFFFNANRDRFTGAGPANRQEREALQLTGWRPYSVMIGDKYVSYQRLDPFATMIGMFADMSNYHRYNPEDEDLQQAFGALSFTLAHNITDKSFLRGVNNILNIFREPEIYFPKTFRDIGVGIAVPNLFDKINDTEGAIMLRESKTFSDALMRKIPFLEDKVPPRRTFMGDAIYRENPLGLLGIANPIYVSSKKNDIVDKEIGQLLHGFSMPEPYFKGVKGIDLREVFDEEGNQAFDRYQELTSTVEIKGKTMRQTLRKMMKSKAYQRIPMYIPNEETGKDTPRINFINRIVRAYRSKAQYELVKEYPELLERYKEARKSYIQQVKSGELNPIPTP